MPKRGAVCPVVSRAAPGRLNEASHFTKGDARHMSNTIVSILLCAILKAVKPDLDPTPAYTVIIVSLFIDTCRLIRWVTRP